jgi:3-oxoacid CoA-transferase subunit A
MNKVFESSDAAVADIQDDATVMVGGFGLCGIPENLLRALLRKGVKRLHTIANDAAVPGAGPGLLPQAGAIAGQTASYAGGNPLLAELMFAGRLKVNLVPQGTFTEWIRAAAAGIPASFTPTVVGTVAAEGKETRYART